MLLRHKVPTIFNIYMLDVICCALGCVILLWQVAHQEASTQSQEAKSQTAKAISQGDAAVRARSKYERAQRDFLGASSDVTNLQNALADWQKRYRDIDAALAALTKDRDGIQILADDRQKNLDAKAKLLALSEDAYKRLQEDLEQALASYKKTKADLTGTVKLNAELLIKFGMAEKQVSLLRVELLENKAELVNAAKKSQEQLVQMKLSQDDAKRLQDLLKALQQENDKTKNKVLITELLLKVSDQNLEAMRKDLKLALVSRDLFEQNLDLTRKDLQLALVSRDLLQKNLDLTKKDLQFALVAKDTLSKDREVGAKDTLALRQTLAAAQAERDLLKDKQANMLKELAIARNAIGTFRLDKDMLRQRIVDLEADLEHRFAGVPLTGENVIFLIDTSGSMAMKDPDTEDPDKWPFLCETLMQLMKSVRSMKRYQIILFSDKTSYLFGKRGEWLGYAGADTAMMARDTLRKVKPDGNTNMHDAFDEAFSYRKSKVKLDTIYLFSDGLPNVGLGIPADLAKSTEAKRSFYLSKAVREKLAFDWNRKADDSPQVRINSVGFFFESPDVGAFLWALSREHRGSFVGLR